MNTIVFCLEEPSAWEMLNVLLPKILPENIKAFPLVFEGKSDLDKRIVKRIRGWRTPNTHFLVLRDKDHSDCKMLKQALVEKVTEAGRADSIVRIACHELETFYLGDLNAVELGLEIRHVAKLQDKQKYRVPDDCANAAEELEKLSGNTYQKIAGSRTIARHLKLDGTNRSRSFNVLIEGIETLVSRING